MKVIVEINGYENITKLKEWVNSLPIDEKLFCSELKLGETVFYTETYSKSKFDVDAEYCQGEVESALCEQLEQNNHA